MRSQNPSRFESRVYRACMVIAAITLLLARCDMDPAYAAAGSQNWRVLEHRETITLNKGPPISFPAGVAVCSDGRVPAVMDLQRKTFRTAGCPPLVIFEGGFE